jgi:hypothetical protein
MTDERLRELAALLWRSLRRDGLAQPQTLWSSDEKRERAHIDMTIEALRTAAAEEREACARVAEDFYAVMDNYEAWGGNWNISNIGDEIAVRIRRMKEQL